MPSSNNKDNFLDKAFTVIAEGIVKIMPIAAKEKQAYIYYREGFAAQNNGDYSEALENYEESLKLEENAIDRGETLKNMAIIYMSNGEEERALTTYQKALEENPKQRLSLAGSLLSQSNLLLLDEPTALLDPSSQKSILEIVRKISRKSNKKPITALWITHRLEELTYCDGAAIMAEGQLGQWFTGEQIISKLN